MESYVTGHINKTSLYNSNSFLYNSEHLFRYIAAIKLKNSDHTLIQVEKILKGMQLEDIDEKFLDNEKFNKETEELMHAPIHFSHKILRLMAQDRKNGKIKGCLLYTTPSQRD